jgi:uncharacterized protein YggE
MRSEILMFLVLMKKKVIALLSVALLAVSARIAMPAEAAFPTPQITINGRASSDAPDAKQYFSL